MMDRMISCFLYAGAWLLGRLPLRLLRAVGRGVGAWMYARDRKEARIARVNLDWIGLGLAVPERERQVREILRNAVANLFETLRIWTSGDERNRCLIEQVHGESLLKAALARGKGMLLVAPHYGNWELLVSEMARRGRFSLVYRDPGNGWGDAFLRLARQREGITLVPANATAMRPLLRALQSGEVVGITPDQQPELSGGVFAPFFGKDALTLTLIPRLAQRTGCALLMAYCEPTASGFDLHFETMDEEALRDEDLRMACAAMNSAVQTVASRNHAQYQWTYKRFSAWDRRGPKNNPYFPSCYSPKEK